MPGFIALKLCPQLVLVPLNFQKYTAASEVTRAVYRRYDPGFRAGSLDEAYLDVTDYCAQRGMTPEQVHGRSEPPRNGLRRRWRRPLRRRRRLRGRRQPRQR